MRLTDAQGKWLRQLARGVQTRPSRDNFRSFDRVMATLVEYGLAQPYVHGGFEITEAGREKLRETA